MNRRGEALFGLLHVPDGERPGRRIGVNLLNPGLKGRVAPNRLNVKTARLLCACGYHVLRFDPAGIGDSEGEILSGNASTLDLWGMIQRGLFVPDTRAANEFFRRECRLDELLLMGQCGGAATALLAAAADRNVAGVALADLPARIVSSRIDLDRFMTDIGSTRERLVGAVKRLARRSLSRSRAAVPANGRHGNPPADAQAAPAGGGGQAPLNLALVEALERYLNGGGRICLVFAGNDFALREYRQLLIPELANRRRLPAEIVYHVVPEANHVYAEVSWQRELHEHLLAFARSFGTPRVAESALRVCGDTTAGL